MTTREIAAFAVVAVSLLVMGFVVVSSMRYRRYERRFQRGHRNDKKVWKPFWIS